jgi:hypothetical protein
MKMHIEEELTKIDQNAHEAKLKLINSRMACAESEAQFEALFQLRDMLTRETETLGMTEDERWAYEAERRWEAGAMGETDSIWYPG